ncbi:MAG: SAM-dependent methyltransferase, partial [Nitrospirota bacterium]
MSVQTSQDPDALPQLIGDFHPVDWWQSHINEIFYGLNAAHLRDYYQTFASADFRLGYALAEDYYQQLCEREKTQNRSEEKTVGQSGNRTLTIMEWGGGSGNLAACFLDRLKELDKEGTFYPFVQYVLIDKFESVINEAKQNPDLAKHQDRMTLLCAGVESLESFEDGTIDRIICNEVWSDLPTKLLIRRGGELMEEHIRPNVSETKLREIADWSGFVQAFDKKDTNALPHFPPFLEDLLWEREYHKVEAKTLPFRRTISDFLKSLGEEVLVPINIGACATLKEAKRLLAPEAIGFS